MSKKDSLFIKFIRNSFNNYLVMVMIICLIVVTIIIQPNFIGAQNLANIMSQMGALSLVALGMTFVVIGGFVDLSVAGIMSLVAVVTITLIQFLGQIPALIIGVGLGALMAAEKNLPWGRKLTAPLGVALIGLGGLLLITNL
jgi:ribose transport system permease protein